VAKFLIFKGRVDPPEADNIINQAQPNLPLIYAVIAVAADENRSAEGEQQIFNLQSSISISGLPGYGG